MFERLRINDLNPAKLSRAWSYFARHLEASAPWLAGALGCGAGAVAMQLLRPWPMKVIFDGVLLPSDTLLERWPLLGELSTSTILLLACGALLTISLLWGTFSFGQSLLTARAGQTVVYELRERVHSHLQRLSLNYLRRRRKGDLLMRLTGDINLLRDMLVNSAMQGVASTLLLVAMLSVLLWMDWQLALVVLALLPVLVITTFRFSSRIRSAAKRQRRHEGRVAAILDETLSDLPVIQSFGQERLREKRLGRVNQRGLRAGLRTTRLEASMSRTIEVLLAAGTAAVLWFGVVRVQAGALTPGDLLVFVSYVATSFKPVRRLSRVSSRMAKATVCASRVKEILREKPEVRNLPGAKRARRIEGRIELRKVSFAYPGRRRTLHRIHLDIEPGSTVALVGPSGSGKSTLLSLLLRLYDPKAGKIRIDGRDLRRYQIETIRHQFGVVLQEPFLFGDSIRENIAFGRPHASEHEIARAVRHARVDRFAARLPNGIDTPIAEAGANLSAGQRQRIAIARAMVRDSPILLLDEPTTGLDATSEAEVLAAIEKLTRGKTTVIVAHKLATVQHADRIAVLRKGRIVEQGTHESLLEADGWYRRNWRRQASEYPSGEDGAAPSGPRRLQSGEGS